MKITSFKALQLEKLEVPFLMCRENLFQDGEMVPLEENLSLKAFIQTKKEDESEFRIGLILETAEKNKSKIDFAVFSLFSFKADIPLTGESGKEDRYITTALSVSYSTLRGYLLQKIPEIGLLPLISIQDLRKALVEGMKELEEMFPENPEE